MATRDAAFLWETEVLRSGARAKPESEPSVSAIGPASDWLTLSEASEVTGVPTSTIRKWARHENIPSVLEQTADGYLRVVSMTGIRHWTEEIGRDIEGNRDENEAEVDLTSDDRSMEHQVDQAPEGSMIVPLDAWNRMLNQLGNLHEAGQQLAEARERAAKAETETRFLKERLSELRAQLEKEDKGSPASVERVGEASSARTDTPSSVGLVGKVYRGWRSRRRRR